MEYYLIFWFIFDAIYSVVIIKKTYKLLKETHNSKNSCNNSSYGNNNTQYFLSSIIAVSNAVAMLFLIIMFLSYRIIYK